MVHFTRACKTLLSENNKTRLTFEKQQEKNKNIICRPWSVRIEKNCALGLEHGPRPAASGRTQDLWHSFSQYGPPGRQIIYIYLQGNILNISGYLVTFCESELWKNTTALKRSHVSVLVLCDATQHLLSLLANRNWNFLLTKICKAFAWLMSFFPNYSVKTHF